MTGALIKGENLLTETDMHTMRIPREDKSDDTSPIQVMLKTASKLLNARGESGNRFFFTSPRRNQPY